MAKKVIDYDVIHTMDRNILRSRVLELTNKGWAILGSVSTCQETQGTAFSQALVLYEGDSHDE